MSLENQYDWFGGFVDGYGSWHISNGRSIFTITQQNPEILYKIQKLVGYGHVNGPYSKKINDSIYYRV